MRFTATIDGRDYEIKDVTCRLTFQPANGVICARRGSSVDINLIDAKGSIIDFKGDGLMADCMVGPGDYLTLELAYKPTEES